MLVRGREQEPEVQIADWQTGADLAVTSPGSVVAGTSHMDVLTDSLMEAYQAPEVRTQPHADEVRLDVLAVGLDRFQPAIDEELDRVASGGAVFKAVRGEYGAGKTFFARWLEERARRRGMATAEVQVSERETPLHRLETVYRRLTENLSTAEFPPSALRPVLDAWLFALEEDVLRSGRASEADPQALGAAVNELLERRLVEVSRTTPPFAAALRGYRRAVTAGEVEVAEGLAAWLGGQPHVAPPSAATPACAGSSTTSGPWASSRACWRCSGTAATEAWWWCWTRSRRCS